MRTGVIGLGDMGSGIAKNLMKNGFQVTGLDLSEARMAAFTEMGGTPAATAAEVGASSDAVFVMVMNGDQAKAVILGDGLVSTMAPGSAVVLSATIKPHEAREIGAALGACGLPDGFGVAPAELYARLEPLRDRDTDIEEALALLAGPPRAAQGAGS